MIALTLSLILNFTHASPTTCDGEGQLFFEGHCYEQVSLSECSVDPGKVELNNSCYELKTQQDSCESEFSLNVADGVCVDTASFSKPEEVFQSKAQYNIKVQLIPKDITYGFQKDKESNTYLNRIFNTYTYQDLFQNQQEQYNYSLSTPLSINPNDFKLYDEHIAPNLFSSVQNSLEQQQALRFKIEESATNNLIHDSKINIAKALESVFSNYGRDMQNYNIYLGVTKVDESSQQTTSFAGVGLPLKNGQFEIKVFSVEKPKDDMEQSNTLESQTGVELSLLNLNSGSVLIDFYGNIHQTEQNHIDESLSADSSLTSEKGWALGTRVKTSQNLDLSVEVGESKIDETKNNSANLNDSDEEQDFQLKLSISYVFPAI